MSEETQLGIARDADSEQRDAEVEQLRADMARVYELALMGGLEATAIRQWIIAVVHPRYAPAKPARPSEVGG